VEEKKRVRIRNKWGVGMKKKKEEKRSDNRGYPTRSHDTLLGGLASINASNTPRSPADLLTRSTTPCHPMIRPAHGWQAFQLLSRTASVDQTFPRFG